MTRRFAPGLDVETVLEWCDLARRAPSAGFSQGAHFLVRGDTAATLESLGAATWFAQRQPGVLAAPVAVLVLADRRAYTDRYAESDKSGHGLESDGGWRVPYWSTDAAMAARAMNVVLDAIQVERAVHLCFGNYGGQTIQKGTWRSLVSFLNSLHVDHLVLELAHRPASDLRALREIDPKLALGVGVIDVKVNEVETPDAVAARMERVEQAVGPGRLKWVHPDCGFWMLKRSVADRKIEALVQGRNGYLGL